MRNTTRQHSSLAFVLQTLNLDPPLPEVFTWHPNPRINPSLWTIRYEFLCYLGVAVLGLVGALRRRYLVLTAFLVSFAAVYALQILFHWRGCPEFGWPGSMVIQFTGPGWRRVSLLALSSTFTGIESLTRTGWWFVGRRPGGLSRTPGIEGSAARGPAAWRLHLTLCGLSADPATPQLCEST